MFDFVCLLRVVCCLSFVVGRVGVWCLVCLVLRLQFVCSLSCVVWSLLLHVCLLFVVCLVIFVGCGCC